MNLAGKTIGFYRVNPVLNLVNPVLPFSVSSVFSVVK